MFDTPARLKIEHWYHLLIVLGAAGALAAMTVELKGVANAHALVMSLGILCIGIGEWINHPFQTVLVLPNADLPRGGKLTGHPRKNSILGVAFVLTGLALGALALYKILQST